MAANKLIIDGVVEIDLTADTVTADKLASGYTAHDKSGAAITGTMDSGVDTSDATATAANILSGKTAYVNGSKVTGTMTDNGAEERTIGTVNQTVPIYQGYHNGSGNVQISSTERVKIIASNIRSGVTILGVAGSLEEKIDTSDATATASDLLSGKTAYVNDAKITGTCTYDADTSDATATAASIESGKTAYVNGSKITGTLLFRTLTTSTSAPTSSDGSVGDIWIVTA